MGCGIQFPVEKEVKKGKGKNEEISCFVSLSSLFSTAVWSERKKRVGEQGMKEGERILWLILVVTPK
jgi:hypothetical protein